LQVYQYTLSKQATELQPETITKADKGSMQSQVSQGKNSITLQLTIVHVVGDQSRMAGFSCIFIDTGNSVEKKQEQDCQIKELEENICTLQRKLEGLMDSSKTILQFCGKLL
jgi:hypothetical protein